MVRDIDLALFGLLSAGQLLGSAIPAPGDEPPPGPVETAAVALRVPVDVAAAARTAGGVVLRDDEMTPLARLELEPATAEAPPPSDDDLLVGTLHRVRHRESGAARAHALTAADFAAPAGRALVVFGRPPTRQDAPRLAALLDSSAEGLLALVADDPHADVPVDVMLDVARSWFDEAGLDVRAQVRTAPVAWRDPDSDAAVVDRLGAALGAGHALLLTAQDGTPGADAWRESRALLERGEADVELVRLSPAVAARLRRWRPDRAHRGLVLMFSGFSGSGKSTVARDLADWIADHSSRTVTLLDGDVVRTMLSSGLGFDKAGRETNIRRIGYVGAEIARHGGIAICAPIAPYAATRQAVRDMVQAVGDFVLVHVSTPLEACEARDLKGLYAKARAGLIPEFTGISDPYEVPTDAELSVDTSVLAREESLSVVLQFLRDGGWLTD